ncbi:uncharacterized protein LOC132277463 [Cornus florida]|uniref:uncharacterized protein LOC132277463 n=1 Tax=Cornus florida TaxID=4283 RepID=UPI002899CBB9|nr:uncharacterized protein LOC132277463 [Cornus florida]
MTAQANTLQHTCPRCQAVMDETESSILEMVDWRRPFIDFLTHGTLPDDKQAAAKLKRKSARFEIREGELFRRTLNGNGQAEASNKNLIRILSRTLEEKPSTWVEQLPLALWAYRTSAKRSTGQTLFSLVYAMEAVLPIDIAVPAA